MNKVLVISLVLVGVLVFGALALALGLVIFRVNPSGGIFPYNMMRNGYGMMGGFRSPAAVNAKPLSVDQARQAVEGYLKNLNNPDLEVKEIIIFDNNAYARITEKSTGIGAMELLVDPSSLTVFPEYGPNMMWNLKYGHMGGYRGMMGGRAGAGMMGWAFNQGPSSATMTVTADQAVKIAQQYLDQQFPGSLASKTPDPFYGYYTIEISKDGRLTGMLSVNGFSGQVFFHSWHGNFIEISE